MVRFRVCDTYTRDKYMTGEKIVESWRDGSRWDARKWEDWLKSENIAFSYSAETVPTEGDLQHWITILEIASDTDAMMLVMHFPMFHGQAYKP